MFSNVRPTSKGVQSRRLDGRRECATVVDDDDATSGAMRGDEGGGGDGGGCVGVGVGVGESDAWITDDDGASSARAIRGVTARFWDGDGGFGGAARARCGV
jgi:hypothetical protein